MLSEWLQNVQNVLESNEPPELICAKAYDWKLSGFYEFVRREARQGGTYGGYFENIRHLIGRLQHTMKAIVFLIKARDRLLVFDRPFRIQREHSPQAIALPLQVHEMNFARIAGKLIEDLADPVQRHVCQAGLKNLDREFGLLDYRLAKRTAKVWKLKVHAELILFNKIRTTNFEFAYNDRYIGCSKPACYCCSMYMEAQPGKCEFYGHHGVAYLAWQAPPQLNQACLPQGAVGDDICLENMINQIGLAILEYFRDPEPEPPRRLGRRNSFTEIATPDP
jgi:hypothetical protein